MPAPEPSATPAAVVTRLLDGITSGRRDLADLYAPDAVVEWPFATPAPGRVTGREALREYFAAAPADRLRLEVRNLVVHETADPEVVVVEYDYDGLAGETGRTFRVANVQVVRVRDGLIVSSRDYHAHAALQAALR